MQTKNCFVSFMQILLNFGTSAKFSPRQQQVQNFPQLVKRNAVYTEGAGPVCKCTGQCTLEGSVQGGG